MLFDDTYKTIAAPAQGLYKDRGSKFLAFAFPVANEHEVKEKIASLKKEHHSAVHHCYAYRLGAAKLAFRSNDDGEPSGSAGKPILGQIQSADLTDILIVVVRYFGGTLLGVPGLIAAYKTSAADAIANAQVVEKLVTENYRVHFSYERMNDLMRILKEFRLEVLKQEFGESCELYFSVRRSLADQVLEKIRLNGFTPES